jgi:hypothetical protein
MSNLYKLGLSDYVKAAVISILSPVVGYILNILQNGSLAINWNQVLILALSGGLSYLLKNFLSDENGKVLGKIG